MRVAAVFALFGIALFAGCIEAAECQTAYDCSGREHFECEGGWGCVSGKCGWMCVQQLPPTTTLRNSGCSSPQDCGGGERPTCGGAWDCTDGKCTWLCESGSASTTLAWKPECSTTADCAGKGHVACAGDFACRDGKCAWDCVGPGEADVKPVLESYAQGDCPTSYAENRYDNAVTVRKTGTDGLIVTHLLDYVCCANVTVSVNASMEGGVMFVNVWERNMGGFCRCICGYNMTVTLSNVSSAKDYFVRVYGVEYAGQKPGLIREASTNPGIAGEGGFCGGIAGVRCRGGLDCGLEGGYPDAGGVCAAGAGLECSSDSECAAGGCSGQVCTTKGKARDTITTCEMRPEYECYHKTSCGCSDGRCGWEKTTEYEDCLRGLANRQTPGVP
jgi:eight-cysteine-cluster-containing protein